MRAVIFYYCIRGKGGKKIHHKLPDAYGKNSYSLSVVKYWVREFKAQRTDLHDEVRPGRPLINVSTQISRLLNDELFSSTRHFARRFAVTKEVVKRSLRKVLGFHGFGLKWVPKCSVRNKRQPEYKCRASYIVWSISLCGSDT
jgi:transposase